MRQVHNAIELLLFFENIIFDNEASFVANFCDAPDHARELLSVYFSSDRIKFYYFDADFQTKMDEISIIEFDSWISSVAPNVETAC